LFRELCERAPPRVRKVSRDEDLRSVCLREDVLRFIDAAAWQLERAAQELLAILERQLYVPHTAAASGADEERELGEAGERDLRDFLHWLSLVMHGYRAQLARWLAVRLPKKVPLVYPLAECLEHTLVEGAFLLFVKRRWPGLLADVEGAGGPPRDAAAEEVFARVLRRKHELFVALCEALDVLLGQWTHLPPQRRAWRAAAAIDKTQTHLQLLHRSLAALGELHLNAQEWKLPPPLPLSPLRSVRLPGPFARHTALTGMEGAERLVVAETFHRPLFTNLVVQTYRIVAPAVSSTLRIAFHHSQGAPCHSETCVLPLTTFFSPETRVLAGAANLARRCRQALSDWEKACCDCELSERFAAMRDLGVGELHLVSHRGFSAREANQAASCFLLPADLAAAWFSSARLHSLASKERDELQRHHISLSPENLVVLPWSWPEGRE
jgi:hypothetical protein